MRGSLRAGQVIVLSPEPDVIFGVLGARSPFQIGYTPHGIPNDDQEYLGSTGGELATTDWLRFSTLADPPLTHVPGTMYWDAELGTVALQTGYSNSTNALGQELTFVARNHTGTTIQNGTLVYISGSTGNRVIVALAVAEEGHRGELIGMATTDILNNQSGMVTVFGTVHDLNTHGYPEGTRVYLSASVPGAWSTVIPNEHAVMLGTVTYEHNNNGHMLVSVRDVCVQDLGVWTDVLPTPVESGLGVSALVVKTVQDGQYVQKFFQYNQADAISFGFQFPHGWDGYIVEPHLHAIPRGNGSGNYAFNVRWCWTKIGTGQAMPAWASWSTNVATLAITAADINEELVLTLAEITPPAWVQASPGSAHLHVWIQVNTGLTTYTAADAGGGGTPAANLSLVSVDTHARIVRFGTRLRYTDA
jgi:hypothetical protein